jgi:hypothetical protein
VSDERSKSSPKEQAQKAEGKSEKSEKPKEESQTPWKLGLNDRIALSQHLFGGNAQDLQRVLSQVGTMENYEQARQFIVDIVRADYDWSEAGEYVERLLELVEAYFLHRK